MNCNEARELLLTADPEELAGGGATPLADHLRDCAQCAAIARAVGADTDALRLTLSKRGSKTARRMALVAALPIAATIVAIVASHERPVAPAPAAAAAASVSVDVARGQTAAVVQTNDPRVTIILVTQENEP